MIGEGITWSTVAADAAPMLGFLAPAVVLVLGMLLLPALTRIIFAAVARLRVTAGSGATAPQPPTGAGVAKTPQLKRQQRSLRSARARMGKRPATGGVYDWEAQGDLEPGPATGGVYDWEARGDFAPAPATGGVYDWAKDT